MTDRRYVLAVAQMGPIARSDSRAAVVIRQIQLLREAHARGAAFVVFPELALTTFFPRWILSEDERQAFYETDMPNADTAPLFAEAVRLGVGFTIGYAEIEAGRFFNTAIVVDRAGKIILKYRKVHLPGTAEPIPGRTLHHLEKRYFEPGNLGFPVARTDYGIAGTLICNDRRWPEAYRMLSLQGAEIAFIGYNTPDDHTGNFDFDNLTSFHNQLSLQAGAYQNSMWLGAAAKCGDEEGSHMIGDSMIVAPSGQIAAQALTTDDEVITARIDLDMASLYRRTIFDFARHREPEQYHLITTRKGPVVEV